MSSPPPILDEQYGRYRAIAEQHAGRHFVYIAVNTYGVEAAVKAIKTMTLDELLSCLPEGMATDDQTTYLPRIVKYSVSKYQNKREEARRLAEILLLTTYKLKLPRKRSPKVMTDEDCKSKILSNLPESGFIAQNQLFRKIYGHSKSSNKYDDARQIQLKNLLEVLADQELVTLERHKRLGRQFLRIRKAHNS